jgi:hypothetical protein
MGTVALCLDVSKRDLRSGQARMRHLEITSDTRDGEAERTTRRRAGTRDWSIPAAVVV